MINSMTGFGLSSLIDNKSEVYIEIKGVNHKFLEVTIKPNDLNNELEEYVRKLVAKKIIRGRVDIRMKIKIDSKTSYSIDSKLLKEFKILDNRIPVIIISGHGTVDLAVKSI